MINNNFDEDLLKIKLIISRKKYFTIYFNTFFILKFDLWIKLYWQNLGS